MPVPALTARSRGSRRTRPSGAAAWRHRRRFACSRRAPGSDERRSSAIYRSRSAAAAPPDGRHRGARLAVASGNPSGGTKMFAPLALIAGILVPIESGQKPLLIRQQDLQIRIEDQVARATLDEIFENTTARPL